MHFATKPEAQRLIELWRSRELQAQDDRDEVPVSALRIAPVTISVESGLQIRVKSVS